MSSRARARAHTQTPPISAFSVFRGGNYCHRPSVSSFVLPSLVRLFIFASFARFPSRLLVPDSSSLGESCLLRYIHYVTVCRPLTFSPVFRARKYCGFYGGWERRREQKRFAASALYRYNLIYVVYRVIYRIGENVRDMYILAILNLCVCVCANYIFINNVHMYCTVCMHVRIQKFNSHRISHLFFQISKYIFVTLSMYLHVSMTEEKNLVLSCQLA